MRKIIILLVCLGVLGGGGFAAYKGYKIYKQKRLLNLARQRLEVRDISTSVLCLRSILAANPRHLEANQLMASVLESMGQFGRAVDNRQRLVELQPDSLTNRLALAKTAFAAGDRKLATNSLNAVSESGKKTALFHMVAADIDAALRQFSSAESHYLEAVRIEPTNVYAQLNLRILQMTKTDPKAAEAGREALRQLASNMAVRSDSLRQLTRDAIAHTNINDAWNYSAQLLKETNAAFGDRMIHLSILQVMTNAQLPSYLATLKTEAGTNSIQAMELGKWLMMNRGSETALEWANSLAPQVRTNMPIPVLMADALAALKKWDVLINFLAAPTNATTRPWGGDDYLRLAFRTRAFKEVGNTTSAKTEWAAAIKATDVGEKRFGYLVRLVEVAGQWQWGPIIDRETKKITKIEPEYEDVLWAAINNFPDEKRDEQGMSQVFSRLVAQLESILYQTQRSKLLLKLYSQLSKSNPENIAAKNNLASVALVLNAMEFKPHQMAQEVYEFDKANPFYSATYAYSLVMQKKYPQAMEVMSKIKPEFLSQPSVSGCYGLVLAGLGKSAEAQKYLNAAIAAKERLLVEEYEIYRQAASGK